MSKYSKNLLVGLTVLSIVSVQSGVALAGGFSIREQSTSGLGSAFAGNAAGYDLSTIFWNPAGVTIAGEGITTESHAAVILPHVKIDPDDVQTSPILNLFDRGSNSIDKVAVVPASYGAIRINDKLTLGYGFNAPFGLATEIDREDWAGQYDFTEAELKTYNFNPVLGYQITSTLSIGVGLQVMYSDLNLKQAAATGNHPNDPVADINVADWSVGYTLGALWRPIQGTSIGVGYRSRMNNTLEGDMVIPGVGTQLVEADFDLPEIFTISLRQDVTSNIRVLGTFEWTNWDILQTVNLKNRVTGDDVNSLNIGNLGGGFVPLQIEANWEDSYFVSGGLEYDYSDQLTLRTGLAYEWSPVQKPTQRLVSIPDSDRVWLSAGATYKYSEMVTFDFAYTHIWGEDSRILRPTGFAGDVESSVDIIALSVKTKWGKDGPLGLLKGLNY